MPRHDQENVLISADGRAVLSDFGTSRLLKNNITIAGTATFKGSVRWTAPELFKPSDEPLDHLFHIKASDVWAFGMVIYVRRTLMKTNVCAQEYVGSDFWRVAVLQMSQRGASDVVNDEGRVTVKT
jgi:serine/threonine protein kinase